MPYAKSLRYHDVIDKVTHIVWIMKYESSNFFKIDSVLKSIKPAGWKVQPWSKTV